MSNPTISLYGEERNPWKDKIEFPNTIKVNNEFMKIDNNLHNKFRIDLRKSIVEGKPLLVSNTEKYRRAGKTTMIVDYLSFVDDACLLVPHCHMRDLYVKEYGIDKDRVIVANNNLSHIQGYTLNKHFIMDEIPFKTFRDVISPMVCPIRDVKLSGIVTIYEDYIVL